MYWDNVWDKNDIEEYRKYLDKYKMIDNIMTKSFREYACQIVCDAACGFGGNSLTLLAQGYDVYGFDIAENAVWLTTNLLGSEGLKKEQYKVASLINTGFPSNFFDAVAIRAALDHLTSDDLNEALLEMKRILKPHGLIYASFDPLEEDDLTSEHQVLNDGGFLYTCEERKGMLFHYYEDDEIKKIFAKYELIGFEKDERGNRHLVVRV